MYKIKASFDGVNFKFNQPLPKGNYAVELTFIKSDKKKIMDDLLELASTWDDDVKLIEDVMEERKNFSSNRLEL
ncbi:MAG: hypothetical protein LBM96_11640 [Methanobrevibacter sp.]|jgi:hypothetical protein|nr:hypothetical protein [Candidatus Methanoflexus mossambicus]